MYKVETLYLTPDYDDLLLNRNRDLVGFVIEKATKKVANVSIVERNSLATWYHQKRAAYGEDKYELAIGSISVIGTLKGAELKEINEKDKPDPLAYRVN